MRIQISAHQVRLEDTLKDYIEKRFEPLARHFDRDGVDVHVVLEAPAGDGKRRAISCSARINVPGGFLVARKSGRDTYSAVDAAEKALQREVEKHHRKVLIGSRFPKKYFVADMVAGGELPALVERGDKVFAGGGDRIVALSGKLPARPAAEADEEENLPEFQPSELQM